MTSSVLERRDVPVLIGGQWKTQADGTFTDVHNPSTGETIARTPMCGAAIVDAAVQTRSARSVRGRTRRATSR